MNRKDFLQKASLMGLATGFTKKLSKSPIKEIPEIKKTDFNKVDFENSENDQLAIRIVDLLPDFPEPYAMKDWKKIARTQDKLLYNFDAKGEFLPLCWWDDRKVNFPIRSFGLPSYVGEVNNGKLVDGKNQSNYESLPVMGSIIGASLVGIDKSKYEGHDFVTMCKQFYNAKNGADLVLNNADGKLGTSFWYEIWPGMAFSMLVDLYPGNEDIANIMKLNASKWIEAIDGLSKGRKYPDFNFTSYSFIDYKGVYNGKWHEPDAAAGLAWIEFAAWKKWGERHFLEASKSCMRFLQNRPEKEGPFYEIMMPYGAYLAVRMNAELGTHYDEMKMLNWCFDGNNTDRDGWGVTTEKWEDYDAGGLVGQKKYDQYAFAMNTFSQAAALVPIVKYNPAYARTIGKWILNLANASRLFYGDEHPKNRQTSALWNGSKNQVISYEGVRKNLDHDDFQVYKGILANHGPYAVGDAVKRLACFTDICPYGSAWVGMLAAIVDTTNVEGILKLDCNATDFFSSDEFPSYLIYNPYNEGKTVELELGDKLVNVYDRVSQKYITKKSTGKIDLIIQKKSAMSLALVPSDIKTIVKDGKLVGNNMVIDYCYNQKK